MIALDQEQVGVDIQAGFVGRGAENCPSGTSELTSTEIPNSSFNSLTSARCAVSTGIDLASGLHKTRDAALSDQKRVAILADQECGGDPQVRQFVSVFRHLDFRWMA